MSFHAYDVALELIRTLRPLLPRIAKFDKPLAKQARDAVNSVSLNLREGNRRLGGDRVYLFSVAAGSADEVRGALDSAEAWGYVCASELAEARALLDRELAMLWKLTHPRGP